MVRLELFDLMGLPLKIMVEGAGGNITPSPIEGRREDTKAIIVPSPQTANSTTGAYITLAVVDSQLLLTMLSLTKSLNSKLLISYQML